MSDQTPNPNPLPDPNDDYTKSLNAHYGQTPDLATAIFDAFRAAGKDPDNITYNDLPAVDQFHSRGRAATIDLAVLADIQPGQIILDVGGGLGGPARLLAAEYHCHVTVLDLTEELIRAGQVLTDRTGLTGRVTFQPGNALDIPFPDLAFDVVWTQHSSMNIPDKPRLYAEIHRVLKPGGTLAIHEIVAGPTQPITFPVPWSSTPDLSYLLPAPDLRALITNSGFRELNWIDATSATLDWLRERDAKAAADPTPNINLNLVIGDRTPEAFSNLTRNHTEGRTTVIMATFERL